MLSRHLPPRTNRRLQCLRNASVRNPNASGSVRTLVPLMGSDSPSLRLRRVLVVEACLIVTAGTAGRKSNLPNAPVPNSCPMRGRTPVIQSQPQVRWTASCSRSARSLITGHRPGPDLASRCTWMSASMIWPGKSSACLAATPPSPTSRTHAHRAPRPSRPPVMHLRAADVVTSVYSSEVQQRQRPSARPRLFRRRFTARQQGSLRYVRGVRDEEVAGSNPVTPTVFALVRHPMLTARTTDYNGETVVHSLGRVGSLLLGGLVLRAPALPFRD
jgi:hypothetical protein